MTACWKTDDSTFGLHESGAVHKVARHSGLREDLLAGWRRPDGRIQDLSSEIEALARQDKGLQATNVGPRHRPDYLERDGTT
jgi:hypothetical protein